MPMRDMLRYAQSLREGHAPPGWPGARPCRKRTRSRREADLHSLQDMLVRLRAKIAGYRTDCRA
jgi:hypothetical protein